MNSKAEAGWIVWDGAKQKFAADASLQTWTTDIDKAHAWHYKSDCSHAKRSNPLADIGRRRDFRDSGTRSRLDWGNPFLWDL
jgi:hypothetical protein